jgi:polyhydroxyalkanoate synthesis regulator phasin
MFDLIQKTMLTGIGMAALTAEKAEQFAKEMAHQMKLSGEKGREFINEAVSRSEQHRKELERTVKDFAAKQLREMHVATSEDIDRLEQRLAALESKLAALEGRTS